MLYHHPPDGVQNFGLSYDPEMLRTMQNSIAAFDLDQILPQETESWCQKWLESAGFSLSTVVFPTEYDRTNPLIHLYLDLRAAIVRHIQSQEEPQLQLLSHPTGAYDWPFYHRPEDTTVQRMDFDSDGVITEEATYG